MDLYLRYSLRAASVEVQPARSQVGTESYHCRRHKSDFDGSSPGAVSRGFSTVLKTRWSIQKTVRGPDGAPGSLRSSYLVYAVVTIARKRAKNLGFTVLYDCVKSDRGMRRACIEPARTCPHLHGSWRESRRAGRRPRAGALGVPSAPRAPSPVAPERPGRMTRSRRAL